jgi:hypothetical protein
MGRFYTDYTNRRHQTYGAMTLAGYSTHTRGWNAGAKITCHGGRDEHDSFSVYMTHGSHGGGSDKLLGTVHDTPDGPRWEPATTDVPPSRNRRVHAARAELASVRAEIEAARAELDDAPAAARRELADIMERIRERRQQLAGIPQRSADENNPGIARHALQLAIDTLEAAAARTFASGQGVDLRSESALLDLRAELARLDKPPIVTEPYQGNDTWDAAP